MSASGTEFRVCSFGEFTLDLARGSLQKNGTDIKLRPQSFDVLCYLVLHHGRLISKDQLITSLWGDAAVTDDSLAQCLIDIRKALGDADRTMIRTVPRRGYLFDVDVVAGNGYAAPRTRQKQRASVGFMLLLGVSGLALLLTMSNWQRIHDVSQPEPSIAVLLFENRSGLSEDLPFVDGVHDQLTTEIGRIDGLRTVSRMSVAKYRDEPASIHRIGEALNVKYVLTGSVFRDKRVIRMTFQLIDADTSQQLWAEMFDKDSSVESILYIQRIVAKSVARSLQAKLMPHENGTLSDSGPRNLEALDQYHDGMYYVRLIETESTTDDSIYEAAIEKFEASIKADPNWAPAHTALGRTYHFWSFGGSREERLKKSKVHINRAIELDDEYAPAYESLGYILHMQRDYEGAARAYDRLQSLGSDMTWGYALYLNSLGRFDEAIVAFQKAISRDPLSIALRHQLAFTYLCAERYEDAIDSLENVLERSSEQTSARLLLAYAHVRQGNIDGGLAIAEKIIAEEGNDGLGALVFAVAGMHDRAATALDQLDSYEIIGPDAMATAAIILGDEDRALDILERASIEAPRLLRVIYCTPEIRSLAGNARFDRVLERLGLPT